MAITKNNFGDCVVDIRGTGLGDCIKQFGDLTGIDIVPKGTSLNTTIDTFDETYYKAQIQGLSLYPLNGIFTFEQTTPENERATGSTGLLADVRQGKPQLKLTYDKGYCFHKNVYDKRGVNRWDVYLKFETAIVMAQNVAGTELVGVDNGLFSVDTFKFQQGSDPEMTSFMIQLKSALQFNSRLVAMAWDELGFDGNLQGGVINTALSYQTTPVAGTALSVFVKDDCNESVTVLGLDDPNEWALGGTQASPTTISAVVYNATTGAYDLTLDVALVSTDTVQPSLADVAGSFDVAENSSGDFYKGQAPIATIA